MRRFLLPALSIAIFGLFLYWLLGPPQVAANPTIAARILVIDEAGNPVNRFEAMWKAPNEPGGGWESGANGALHFYADILDASIVFILVRADGYATKVVRLERAAFDALESTPMTIPLSLGKEYRIRFETPEGVEMPADFVPEIYPEEFAGTTRLMWQLGNSVEAQRGQKHLDNYFNVKATEGAEFSIQLAKDSLPFYVACNYPGWLRFFEAGPFTAGDALNGTMTIELPRPAVIEVQLDMSGRDTAAAPFDDVTCDVSWPLPSTDASHVPVNVFDNKMSGGEYRVADLAPNRYLITVRTQPKSAENTTDFRHANIGRFTAREHIDALPGTTTKKIFSYVPLDATAWKGDASVRLKVLLPNGAPASRRRVKVQWSDGHYGRLDVFEGPANADGVVELNGVSTRVYPDATFGPFAVEVEGKAVGFFRLQSDETIQEVELRIAPEVGDNAPDFPLVDLKTGHELRLTEFSGKVVLIEFWATWCGPCQPAMSQLVREVKAEEEAWKGAVVVIPLSTDKDKEIASRHLNLRGWDAVPQYWAVRKSGEYATIAENAFGVHGIPLAVLIDPNGKIAWRGNPADDSDGWTLVERVKALSDR